MSKLMDDVSSGKIAYQGYTIEHGIEKIHIQIPLTQSKHFEREFANLVEADQTSKRQITKLMTECGGKFRKVK